MALRDWVNYINKTRSNNVIHLMIVDDHALMREGLKQLFEGEDDIIVGAEAASGEEVLAILQKENIDLVLLDLSIPGIHGVELIAKIREMPDSPPILVLSMHNEPQIAIRKVAAGGRYIAGDIAERIAFEASSAAPLVPHELLSGRELMILRMLAKGKKVHEIAQELDISSKTVSTHKARLMQKMHIDSDVKLVQYAIAHGMTV